MTVLNQTTSITSINRPHTVQKSHAMTRANRAVNRCPGTIFEQPIGVMPTSTRQDMNHANSQSHFNEPDDDLRHAWHPARRRRVLDPRSATRCTNGSPDHSGRYGTAECANSPLHRNTLQIRNIVSLAAAALLRRAPALIEHYRYCRDGLMEFQHVSFLVGPETSETVLTPTLAVCSTNGSSL